MRRVRRLQLSAPDDGLRRRGQLLLEDALRTATLPGAEEARLVLVRRLRVEAIDPRGGSAAVARSLAERLRQAGLTACPGEDPAAERAPVVAFASALEASIALATRLGRGEPAPGWHWPLAVPAYRPGAAAADNLRSLLQATFALPGAAVASAVWLEALVEAGAAEPLLASLSAADAEGLLRLGGWPPTPEPAMAPAPAGPLAALPALWRAPLACWLPRWGPTDPRGLWLVAMALAARQPARVGSPSLLAQAQATLRALEHPPHAAPRDAAASAEPPGVSPRQGFAADAFASSRARGTAAASAPAETEHQPPLGSGAGPGDRPEPLQPAAAADAPAESPRPQPQSGPEPSPAAAPAAARADAASVSGHGGEAPESNALLPPHLDPSGFLVPEAEAAGRVAPAGMDPALAAAADDAPPRPRPATSAPGLAQPSAWAGLAFLVVLLRLEGFEGWLERHPALLDADLPRRLLRGVADGLGVPQNDPLRIALALEELAPPPATGALASAATVACLSRRWRRRLRRWGQRPGRPTVRDLTRRPGLVVASRTHLEVWFEPRQAEIRLRRHGLDLDPGWVPWLGRVLTFHYDRRGPGDGER
jgi:hypothetical protein